jgi:hypothetical protein
MDILNNIWQHPKTTVVGLLIAVATVTGVLSQQGITLGTAGTGTVVALVGALAAAFLGLFSRDPEKKDENEKSTSTGFLGVIAICMIMLSGAMTTGCTATQVDDVVAKINAYLPTVIALVNEAITVYDAVGTSSSDTDTVASNQVLDVVKDDLVSLQKPLADYLAATSKQSKQTAWLNVMALIDTAATDADKLLAIAAVKNSDTQSRGVVVIAAIDAAVHILDGYVAATQTTQQVQATAAKRSIKLRQIARYWSPQDKHEVASHFGMPYMVYMARAQAMGF